MKGGVENFLSNPGGVPIQRFPTNMANGPQPVQVNGVSSQQHQNRPYSGYYQQPRQQLPPKVILSVVKFLE